MTTTPLKKCKRHCQDSIEVYHFASRTKTRDKVATMYDILIRYSTLENVDLKYIQVHNYATVTGVCKKTMVKIIRKS